MLFTETNIKGVYSIHPELKKDIRGYFTRIYCKNELSNTSLRLHIVQINQSCSLHAGTIRGLHVQKAPFAEDKLVQCLKGSVFDVVVDLRVKSKTYGKWIGEVLSEKNKKMMFVPKGCAHGYQTLENNSIIQYAVSAYYTPKAEFGIRWDDSYFQIKWPIKKVVLSEKDSSWKNFVP